MISRTLIITLLACLAVSSAFGTTTDWGTGFVANLCDPVTGSCDPVNVTARFTTKLNEIDIEIVNYISNPVGDISNLNQVDFHITSGVTTGSTISSTAILRTLASNGTYTDSSLSTTAWGLQNLTNEFVVDGRAIGSAFPRRTLIGMPDSNNLYSAANGSINTPSHNPFLATKSLSLSDPLNPIFVIHLQANSGVTAATDITSVLFEFGTGANLGVNGHHIVPEPGTWSLGLGGILLLVGAARRRRSKT